MIKKSILFFFCGVSMMFTNAYAVTTHVLRLGSGIEYVLPVNEPQLLANPFLWTIKITCTIKSEQENNLISFKVTKKTGTFNGAKFSVGDSMRINLHPNDKIQITAVSGGEVELLNLSNQVIRAECEVS